MITKIWTIIFVDRAETKLVSKALEAVKRNRKSKHLPKLDFSAYNLRGQQYRELIGLYRKEIVHIRVELELLRKRARACRALCSSSSTASTASSSNGD